MNDANPWPGAPIGVTAEQIEATLLKALGPEHLEVIDESADHAGHAGSNGLGHGTHFRVRIGSSRFAGLARVARHRLVYDALRSEMAGGVHALAIELLD